jgi:hypothetical protein
MASRPHTTDKKRQKELARMEKQRDKVAKRQQRKDKPAGESYLIEGVDGPDSPMLDADGTTQTAESPAQNPDSPAQNPDNPAREG